MPVGATVLSTDGESSKGCGSPAASPLPPMRKDTTMDETRQRGRPRKPRPPGVAGQLGQVIEQHRKELGLSAEELGTLAGLGLGTIIRVERGEQYATLDTVLAIAHALGMGGNELLSACTAWNAQPEKKGTRHVPPRK